MNKDSPFHYVCSKTDHVFVQLLRQLLTLVQSLMQPLQEVRKHLKAHYWVCCGAAVSESQHRLTEGIKCWGQRLIKQRGTFAPALLTNLSPPERRDTDLIPMLNLHFCCRPISSQNSMSVYGCTFWRDPSKSYGYAIMSRGGRSIFAGLSYHYILNKRFIVCRQGKKNAKVKDTGGGKYIAMERRTPLVGAKAAKCVYPSRSAVSESCRGHQSTPLLLKTTPREWLQQERRHCM